MNFKQNLKNLFITLSMGLVCGLVISVFFKSLFWVQNFQATHSHYILLLPLVWLILKFTKKMTLYFPVSVSDVYNTNPATYKYWNKFGFIFNFIGSVLSHFSGASIGREGVAVTLSSTLAQVIGLDWAYWRSIVVSASFGIATGSPLIAVAFLFEVFISSADQKILTLAMSWVGSLVLQSYQMPHLLKPFFVLDVNPASEKLIFIFCAGAIIGLLSRFYKTSFFIFKKYFDKSSIVFTVVVIFLVSIILYQPQFKDIHSLSLAQFQLVQTGLILPEFVFYKILFTLFFVSVGFWGGDFVPSVLIGSGLGVILAKYFSIDPMFGLMVGSFSFFCGLTRLKWTALFLTLMLVGWHQIIWVYLFLTVCNWFSGTDSLYTTEPSMEKFFWTKFF